MLVALVVALLLAAGGIYWLKSSRRQPAARPAKAGGRFGGVEIRTRSSACAAAHELEGKRFLSKNAPALPLPKCTEARCSCTFAKLKDRRSDSRRIEHGALSASLFLATNRRKNRDRRRV